MLLPLLFLLASSIPGPIQGDFDHDGLPDKAQISRTGRDVYHLEIIRGAAPGLSTRLPLHLSPPDYLKLAAAQDRVATACGKGMGPRSQPCPHPKVDLRQGDLLFGYSEASEAAVLWDGQAFQIEWLTD